MAAAIPDLKNALRRDIRARLAAMTEDEKADGSRRLRESIGAAASWRAASAILGFVALPSEPDLSALLASASESGRTVCVPRWNAETGSYEAARLAGPESLRPGPFGVPEPADSLPSLAWERLDLILVPGLAFDRHGWRLGRGRGFFDRILSQASSARRWGVAFDRQVVEHVPHEPHDVNVHTLATPQLGLLATE